MGSYHELHQAAEDWIVQKLKTQGHKVIKQQAQNHEVIFDVYDKTEKVAYEVLTAKIVRSSHEQDEMILYKLFHYLLLVPKLRFYLVSFGKEEIEMFHNLGLEHWHLYSPGWLSMQLKSSVYHKGKKAREIANKIFKAITKFAPLSEWTREERRKQHSKAAVEKEFAAMTKQLGLPKNFLMGLWRDWRLLWVWRLEYILPIWSKRNKLKHHKILQLLAKIPKKIIYNEKMGKK